MIPRKFRSMFLRATAKVIVSIFILVASGCYHDTDDGNAVPVTDYVIKVQLDSTTDSVSIYYLENLLLQNNIERANQTIALQNSQLEQSNDIYAIYLSILGASIAIFSFVVYLLYLRPIQEQKEEIKELKLQSESILADIQGTLQEKIDKKYQNISTLKLKEILRQLHQPAGIGGSVLSLLLEYKVVGFSNDESELVLEYLTEANIQNYSELYNVDINLGVKILFEVLQGRGLSRRTKLT